MQELKVSKNLELCLRKFGFAWGLTLLPVLPGTSYIPTTRSFIPQNGTTILVSFVYDDDNRMMS